MMTCITFDSRPYVLSTTVLADIKKAYGNDENDREEIIVMAVSYYFDKDEYEGFFSYKRFESTDKGDETETNRGMHVANALVACALDINPRFGQGEHFDLSGDPTTPHNFAMAAVIPLRSDGTKLSAFAMFTPTVADLNGNNERCSDWGQYGNHLLFSCKTHVQHRWMAGAASKPYRIQNSC